MKRDQAEEALFSITGLENIKILILKIRSLRGAYNNELRKVKSSQITESGCNEVYKLKLQWFNYAHSFLAIYVVHSFICFIKNKLLTIYLLCLKLYLDITLYYLYEILQLVKYSI